MCSTFKFLPEMFLRIIKESFKLMLLPLPILKTSPTTFDFNANVFASTTSLIKVKSLVWFPFPNIITFSLYKIELVLLN